MTDRRCWTFGPHRSSTTFQKPAYNDPRYYQHKIHYGAGNLIRIWCRHQYIKGLFPTFIALWYWILAYISLDYQIKSSHYISEQLNEYSCSQTSQTDISGSISCSNLDSSTSQYYYYDGNKYQQTTVSCSIPGVDLYYPNTYYDVYSSNYYIQLIVNFIFPFLATYFFYETMTLALRDCLVIVPGLNSENQPILQYARKPYRVSWFVCHRISRCFSCLSFSASSSSSMSAYLLPAATSTAVDDNTSHNDQEILLSEPTIEDPHKQPGIRIGRVTSIAINIFLSLLFSTMWAFVSGETSALGGNQFRCTKQAASATNYQRSTLDALLIIYLLLAMIPTSCYYIRLFFYVQDIELLAYQYSHERYQPLRSVLDISLLFFFPLWLDIAFFFAIYLPTCLLYYLCNTFSYCCYCCSFLLSKESREENWKALNKRYFNHVFIPKSRWWVSWFVLPIDEKEFKEYDELIPDEVSDDGIKQHL
jgi:hypothetical protein